MTKNRKMRVNALKVFGTITGLTAVYRAFEYVTVDGQILGIVVPALLSCIAFFWARDFSKRGKDIYSLDKLITRAEDKMTFRGTIESGYVIEKGIELEVSRLSILSIRDDYASVIIDGNGNGYDIMLDDSAQAIESHIRSLLSEVEQENITFNRVK